MWSNRRFFVSFMFMINIIIIVIVRFGASTRTCLPNKLIQLSNCSFRHLLHTSSSYLMNNDNRTLTMIVPYPIHPQDEQHALITIFTSKKSFKPLIRFHLNIIQCTEKKITFNWTSLETSSTPRGEFVRTSHIDGNLMYLSSGKTYLKNLTSLDCSTRTIYQTDAEQFFELDLKIESTSKDFCTDDRSCYPHENYQCHSGQHRCHCRKPFQIYSIRDQYPICLQAVQTMDQCTTDKNRCLEWCRQNSSSTLCLCPVEISTKKFSTDQQEAFCESRIGGICNSLIHCPSNGICIRGICQHHTHQSSSLDLVTISIIVACLVLFLISLILVISIYVFRRQHWKKKKQKISHRPRSHQSLFKDQPMSSTSKSDYDNIIYDVFKKKNIQLSSSTDEHDQSPMTTSEDYSYEPKVVYLGGDEQLTAIFA